MKTGTTTLAGLVLISLVFSASGVHAELKVTYPPNPETPHVTELAIDTPKCDSTFPLSTWSYEVTWKPVYVTWQPSVQPYIWTHYEVASKNSCVHSIVICDGYCKVRVFGCSYKVTVGVTKVAVYWTEEETGSGGMSIIGGMLRPPMKRVGTTVVCS